MTKLITKLFVGATCVFLYLGIAQGTALGIQITVDAITDAGQYPGETAYRKFVDKDDTKAVLYVVPDATEPRWSSVQDVVDFANGIPIETDWLLYSSGDNSNGSSDTIVGYSLTGLEAGTYRIRVSGGAFEYDSFNWSQYFGKWFWGLNIGTNLGAEYTLGSFASYDSQLEALQNNIGRYVDISIGAGGSLVFWIDDWNSIDNVGSLSFDVTPVPEPSTLLLLTLGLAFLLLRNKHCILDKRD